MSQERWDQDYMALAEWWAARRSKDPRTQVGAVVVGPNKTILGIGYNGFPRGVSDIEERYADRSVKHMLVVHAEANAILTSGIIPTGSNIYTTSFPCVECAKLIVQVGLERVVYGEPYGEEDNVNWVMTMFREAGVLVQQL